jgi:hypothetical protein
MGANLSIVKKNNPASMPLGNTMHFPFPPQARNRLPEARRLGKTVTLSGRFLPAPPKACPLIENLHTQAWEML